MKWTVINYPDELCMEWNVCMEYRREFYIYITFFFITINGRFKIELQLLLPWWGLQEVSSSPCPEQGLWPYQAPQKVHGEDHDRQLCFQIPRKSINLQPCFQIPRKMVVCIVLHPAWRPIAGFPGGAGTLGDFASPEEGLKASYVVAHLQFYTSVLFISWVNSTLIVSALRAEAQSSQAWNLAVCRSLSTVLDSGSRVALHLLETFLCSVVVGWNL